MQIRFRVHRLGLDGKISQYPPKIDAKQVQKQYLQSITKGTAIHTQDEASKACQLSRFSDLSQISAELSVSSPGMDYRHFLVWKGSQEEAVLNVQGVVVEAYLPPVIHSKKLVQVSSTVQNLTIFSSKCERTFQMVKVAAPAMDKQFSQAYQAISHIYNYMSRHDEHVSIT
ncbi:uncharacterized protein EV420DRAFT_1488282 [Desarmillaria tabescens]|uniref:Uncharacterized protein n=1 Tax=Armillaria tabescens TaxID=1929756 RepID=A0AA39MIJ6_ARMTA|nr:uncharacterized protein EV420DRAFT_1488282 [Desarmillaria tabescens]KAK0435004.1 hypothetical protein EV420DRAFT_1488282 [Desarmillaria tabescens]